MEPGYGVMAGQTFDRVGFGHMVPGAFEVGLMARDTLRVEGVEARSAIVEMTALAVHEKVRGPSAGSWCARARRDPSAPRRTPCGDTTRTHHPGCPGEHPRDSSSSLPPRFAAHRNAGRGGRRRSESTRADPRAESRWGRDRTRAGRSSSFARRDTTNSRGWSKGAREETRIAGRPTPPTHVVLTRDREHEPPEPPRRWSTSRPG